MPYLHLDYGVTKDCKNLMDSYGEICVKCNKCGRFGKDKRSRKYIKKENLDA